jgi:tetratricopeptide (TPR) repeat protein
VYLPSIGLLLIALEGLRRVELPARTLAAVLACLCLVPAFMTWRRAGVWTSSTRLWEDSAATAPGKPRPHVGLGNAYMHENRCREASREYEAAYQLASPDFTLNYNRAAAFECIQQPLRAIEVLQDAISQNPRAAANHALMGMVLAERGKWQEGLDSLDKAQQLDANYAPTYAYRGAVLVSLRQPELAAKEFEKCLRLDPNNAMARRGWAALHPEGS